MKKYQVFVRKMIRLCELQLETTLTKEKIFNYKKALARISMRDY